MHYDSLSNSRFGKCDSKLRRGVDSAENTDSDEDIDPQYVYADNPLYTSKGELFSSQEVTKESIVTEKTPKPVHNHENLFEKPKVKFTEEKKPNPMIATNYSKYPARRYSIDAMLVMSRIEKKYNKINEIDHSILKRKLFPVCRKSCIKEAHSLNMLPNRSTESKLDIFNQSRRILKVNLHKIEFQEHAGQRKFDS